MNVKLREKCSQLFGPRIGWDGNPVERIPETDPYSYDLHFTWKSENFIKEKCSIVYSDRLFQWNPDKFRNAAETVWENDSQMFHGKKPSDIETFLSLYLEKDIILTAVLEGCNVSNGFPYWMFAYQEK